MKTTKRVAALIGGASLLTAVLAGCSNDGVKPTPKWDNGSFVKSVVNGQRGQVIRLRCFRGEQSCYYDVRFAGLGMTTNTKLIGSDGPIDTTPLVVVDWMREYELTDG